MDREQAATLLRTSSWILSDLGLVEAYWADDAATHLEEGDSPQDLRSLADWVVGRDAVQPLLTDTQKRARCFIATVLLATTKEGTSHGKQTTNPNYGR